MLEIPNLLVPEDLYPVKGLTYNFYYSDQRRIYLPVGGITFDNKLYLFGSDVITSNYLPRNMYLFEYKGNRKPKHHLAEIDSSTALCKSAVSDTDKVIVECTESILICCKHPQKIYCQHCIQTLRNMMKIPKKFGRATHIGIHPPPIDNLPEVVLSVVVDNKDYGHPEYKTCPECKETP